MPHLLIGYFNNNLILQNLSQPCWGPTACFFGMRAVLTVHKRKTPCCPLTTLTQPFKMEIRRQIGEGGGECPPVSDSCLDWQRRMCQSGSISVFSPCSTALTEPAARPEVCRFHQFYPRTRAADINYQELSQMVSLKAFFPFILEKKFIHLYFYCFLRVLILNV